MNWRSLFRFRKPTKGPAEMRAFLEKVGWGSLPAMTIEGYCYLRRGRKHATATLEPLWHESTPYLLTVESGGFIIGYIPLPEPA